MRGSVRVGSRAAARTAWLKRERPLTCARLAALARSSGALVKRGNVDVTDADEMAKFLLSVDKSAPVECAPAVCTAQGLRVLFRASDPRSLGRTADALQPVPVAATAAL